MSSNAVPLDFATLLSKNYRGAADASKLIANEAYSEHEKPKDKKQRSEIKQEKKSANDKDVSKLVMQLVSETPAFRGRRKNGDKDDDGLEYLVPRPPPNEWETLPPELHGVELDDWESKIDWEGGSNNTSASASGGNNGAVALLEQRRNPYLDALVFDDTNVCWDGSREDAMEKASRVKLILEKGTAGQSIARSVLPVDRPMSYGDSEAYQRRYEREWSTPASSSAELSKGSLHADKEQMEAFVAERQKKREQMAIDKSVRVTEAMGTLSAAKVGKGRAITSSLMGPGGTERTGRPSRHLGSSSRDIEYVKQLDFVDNHALVIPELSRAQLRQYHRPKLPLSIVRTNLPWQFQIRFVPSANKADSVANASSYQSMMGSHAGTLAQSKIKRESDLSPSEGNLILLEYSEERPPIQLTKGMASKIINYYRGDKSKCPISAGGGDRPTRKKRQSTSNDLTQSSKNERSTRLLGPDAAAETTVMDWIGKPPKKTTRDERKEKQAIDVLPEGVTEILHKNVHGPFIGDIEDGVTQTGLISNLLVAPMFQQEPESTDFLMILDSTIEGPPQRLGVVLRSLPTTFTVGQTEPRIKVNVPGGNKEKNFTTPFFEYQIAKLLNYVENTEGRGMRSDEVLAEIFPEAKAAGKNNAFRPRFKNVADCEGNTYTLKSPMEFPGVEAVGKRFTPEDVAAYETACAASRRLRDLGIITFDHKGTSSAASVAIAVIYLTAQVNALRDMSKKVNKSLMVAKGKGEYKEKIPVFEKAAAELESEYKEARRRLEVARFVYEELQLTPWHLTGEFVDVHKGGGGTGMMKLTGVGDPSGRGEGFNFMREEAKSNKATGNTDGALDARIKKITGTDNDLRRLTMKQMASILRSYGMGDKQIATLKRWDRVHVIRDLSTKEASDGLGDGDGMNANRFARGEKMKLSEQKQQYRDRVQEIWRRQRAALTSDPDEARVVTGDAPDGDGLRAEPKDVAAEGKDGSKDKDDESSSSSDDDDDLMAAFEADMTDQKTTHQLLASQTPGGAERMRAVDTSTDAAQDAQALAAMRREKEEEKDVAAGLIAGAGEATGRQPAPGTKVIRRRVTKTYPDGRQTTTFKFIVNEKEVEAVTRRKSDEATMQLESSHKKKAHKHEARRRQIGHSMFEDEDESKILHRTTRTVNQGRRGGRHKPHLGKLKSGMSQESRNRKRQRQADEADLYAVASKRLSATGGSNNRRNRGSKRDKMPHVVFAKKLEGIRSLVERRPASGPFHKPVNRRQYPRYYEVISNPIDLSTIREKIQKYAYSNTDVFLRDFELMKNNALRFNGPESSVTKEAVAIYEQVKSEIADNRAEFDEMIAAVEDQMNNKKPRKKARSKSPKASAPGAKVNVDGVQVNLGEQPWVMLGSDSDSD